MLDASVCPVEVQNPPRDRKATDRLLRDLRNMRPIRSTHADVVIGHAEQHGVPCQRHPDWFFPASHHEDTPHEIEAAQRLCGTCPVREACLAWALEDREPHGVWGGATVKERRRMRGLAA